MLRGTSPFSINQICLKCNSAVIDQQDDGLELVLKTMGEGKNNQAYSLVSKKVSKPLKKTLQKNGGDKMNFNHIERSLLMKNTYYFLLLGITSAFLLGGCAKGDRVVLSSESADYLKIHRGRLGVRTPKNISKSKLAQVITDRYDSVSKVYNLSGRLSAGVLLKGSYWYITFSVETVEGVVYNNFECIAFVQMRSDYEGSLLLRDCHNDQDVWLGRDRNLTIPINEVILQVH